MSDGANSLHKELRTELENYIKSQYFGKSPILLSALEPQLDTEGVLYRKPYIESSPAYKGNPDWLHTADIPDWMKLYFKQLSDAGLGVYSTPFIHQVQALEAACQGKDVFVATGTGSGKTECFMWPLMAKMADEARNRKESWQHRGVRVIIMYPMNALVSDQISRLRKLIGDEEGRFVHIFRDICGASIRRPQFGMYTGRTPYPGPHPVTEHDRKLEKTLRQISFPTDGDKGFFEVLKKEGKVPAKSDMKAYLDRLHHSEHEPDPEDAELITRFEMQKNSPDILITNYSMLEYMLLRPQEKQIWEDTQNWLQQNRSNRLLFVIDEAHMYRGSSGGEVAFLIRRLFHKLGISRDRVQFILTTASMPAQEAEAVMKFAADLTGADDGSGFCYLTGVKEELHSQKQYDIPLEALEKLNVADIENEETRLSVLNMFWRDLPHAQKRFQYLENAYAWMYEHLLEYRPFYELVTLCRGQAVSLDELAATIFPDAPQEQALAGIGGLLAIAPLARNKKGAILFPVRMHMLFKGIKGVYACTNPDCPHSHQDDRLALGEIFLEDGHMRCPHCHSVVYELYNDRRCGALFYKGYIWEEDFRKQGVAYLWHSPSQFMVDSMKEIHLFIPDKGYEVPKGSAKNPIRPCYLDTKSGFVYFRDDSMRNQPGIQKLYYCDYISPGHPDILTFSTCPHCHHMLSQMQLTSFSTRGNQSFYNLIKAQFQAEPPVKGKNIEEFPNQGRKVLLFSDSRQRAAKLARDMSEMSDVEAARQLFAIAIERMNEQGDLSLNDLYGYFCLAALKEKLKLFQGDDKTNFEADCAKVESRVTRLHSSRRRGQRKMHMPVDMTNAPRELLEDTIRLFSGGYNTLTDSAVCWLEPTDDTLDDAMAILEENHIDSSEDEFLEVFNAWILHALDIATALGHVIPDEVRYKVRRKNNKQYGLGPDWDFGTVINSIMGWKKGSPVYMAWRRAMSVFLSSQNTGAEQTQKYVDLSSVTPIMDPDHEWYKCDQCSEITPYCLKGCCPSCGSRHIHKMKDKDYEALDFWRKPLEDALHDVPVHIMDTEEHTAQLSHKDERDEMWSKTESYELRFQDIVQEDDTPVDILSSTTTMEVGIDIGSLIAVGMRNIPPMRENYQQRAGRAGRRGAVLSTIVTFCEDGPHDTLYFHDPVPMFRGDPRKPWIDIQSPKLMQRHIGMVAIQAYLSSINSSLDQMSAVTFLNQNMDAYFAYLKQHLHSFDSALLPLDSKFNFEEFMKVTEEAFKHLKEKCRLHRELYVQNTGYGKEKEKKLLDALYEKGIIPTYSFPKNVVSTYVMDNEGKIKYAVDRGLDIAIGEYAPGRAIVVDKQTYQIGGFYYPGSEKQSGKSQSPARAYMDDKNYVKAILTCPNCGWFGLEDDGVQTCPFCGEHDLIHDNRKMLRPWGFAPKNAQPIQEAQLNEEYSYVQQPLYSTLPESDKMNRIAGMRNIRMASRTNQRIIMINRGPRNRGFMVCPDCGAAMPGNEAKVLNGVKRPYKNAYSQRECRHPDAQNVNLGYDFVTDMLVLEFALDDFQIDTSTQENLWLPRAAQSLAEALRLEASKELDIEFTELVTGYRVRHNTNGTFVDIYLYDSLSSGAGYAVSVADSINELLAGVEDLLTGCSCENACYKCLKHYRNQNIHHLLDRFCALQLLRWGRNGSLAEEITKKHQKELLAPLVNILDGGGCHIDVGQDTIWASKDGVQKEICIYPAMWKEPINPGIIYISDAYVKYAMPLAVQKILKEL